MHLITIIRDNNKMPQLTIIVTRNLWENSHLFTTSIFFHHYYCYPKTVKVLKTSQQQTTELAPSGPMIFFVIHWWGIAVGLSLFISLALSSIGVIRAPNLPNLSSYCITSWYIYLKTIGHHHTILSSLEQMQIMPTFILIYILGNIQ